MNTNFGTEPWDIDLDILPFAEFSDYAYGLYGDKPPVCLTKSSDETEIISHHQTDPVDLSMKQQNTCASMTPTNKTRKPKAKTLRDSDWQPFRDLIIDLHIRQNQTLLMVKVHMEQEYGFCAEWVFSYI